MGRRVRKSAFKFQKFSQKQKKILTWWLPESPVHDKDGIIADGAIRSGKTVAMALSFIMWAMFSFKDQNFAMCGKTIGSFRRNVLMVLKLMLRSRGYRFKDQRADNLLEVTWKGRTNYFYIFGGKDERSQDLIQGITLAGVFFDEVALMPESFVNQATGRCSVDGSKFWFNCNPEGPYHYFKVKWIDRAKEKNQLHLHFTMDDNLSLSEKIKARYAGMYAGVFYQRYILGLWVVAEGIIYDMFSKERHIRNVRDYAGLLMGTRYISVDYGTQNATVFLMWEKGADGVWYCIRHYYYSGREKQKQKTDEQYVKDMTDFIDGAAVRAIIVDPSAASFIAALREAGYPVMEARNDVLDGIRAVARYLNMEKIRFSDTCKEVFKEFGSYVWDEKAAERGEDAPVKAHDHCMDAIRYFVYTILVKGKAKVGNKAKLGVH